MRIIHCSDLHLDADLRTKYDAASAAERRTELLGTFRRLCLYAKEQGVSAVLICGDLFDTESPSPSAVRAVEDLILINRDVLFFYLRGNHDSRSALFGSRPKPDNLLLFGEDWTGYELSGGNSQGRPVRITGREPGGTVFTSPDLDPACINIVMLHGQVREGYAAPDPESVPLSALRGRGIDYLALGHLHHYRSFPLDERGSAAYSGCLEGRGFDETGDKGYVALTAGNTGVQAAFCPWGRRKIHDIALDVTGQDSNSAVWKRLRQEALPGSDLVRVRLTGERTADSDLSAAYLEDLLGGSCYALQVRDETVPVLDPGELSLRGEFARLVRASGLDEADKADILRAGLAALRGGEVEL